MLSLPDPGAVPSLNDDVFSRIKSKYPGVLHQKPLDGPDSDCRTCGGTRTFRWLSDLSRSIVPVPREIPKVGQPNLVDTVYELVEEPEVADYECECWRQARIQAFLLAHGLGKAAARTCWADTTWVNPDVLGPIREYADDCESWASRGMGLYLYSQNYGSGKSLVANLVLKSFLRAGVEGYWITFNQMLAMHMNSWRDEEEREWFEKHVRNAQVLVIDDIGKESNFQAETDKPTNWRSIVTSALDSIFRMRVQMGLVTIITSNYLPSQIGMEYTAALGSLVVEGCLPYQFTAGIDIRPLYTQRVLMEAKFGLTRPFVFG